MSDAFYDLPAVQQLERERDAAHAQGFAAGVEAAAVLLSVQRPAGVAKWRWEARVEEIRSLAPGQPPTTGLSAADKEGIGAYLRRGFGDAICDPACVHCAAWMGK